MSSQGLHFNSFVVSWIDSCFVLCPGKANFQAALGVKERRGLHLEGKISKGFNGGGSRLLYRMMSSIMESSHPCAGMPRCDRSDLQ
jgi:hypothetical protein